MLDRRHRLRQSLRRLRSRHLLRVLLRVPHPTLVPSPNPTPETGSPPTKPTGTTSTYTNHSYTYTTGGAVDNYGYSVQYYFDWGDGTSSGWLPVGTVSATKTWTAAARACAITPVEIVLN